MTLRPVLVSIHRWIGLGFGLLLILQGLTGVAITFRAELNRTLHADALLVSPAGTMVPVQKLLDEARGAHPGFKVSRIEYPASTDQAFMFRMEPKDDGHHHILAVDPYRGTITRDGELSEWPVEWLFELHHELLAGETGATLVGIAGIALLFLALTGPFLWWPGARRIWRSFVISFQGGTYRATRDLHRVVGIAFALLLALSAFTGIVMVWKAPLQPVINMVLPTIAKPSVKVKERADVALLPLDQVVAVAQARYGGAQVRNVRFPGGSGRVVNVFLEADDYPRPRASNQIWLDGYTARPLGTYEAATNPPGNGFIDWMLPIHSGEFLGQPGRWLFLFEALALAGFGITGFWMWIARRRLIAAANAPAGRKRLQVSVTRTWNETANVRGVELRAADGGALPSFTAGAHIDLFLSDGLIRQYSLWSDPARSDRYCIAVLREPRSRGGSDAVHALTKGARLMIGEPRNSFPLVEDAAHILLIAGGIGITPLFAMATRLHAIGKPFTLHYAARSQQDAALISTIKAMPWADRLRTHFGASQRFSARSALEAAGSDAEVFVCGPARLIDDVMTTARSLGRAEERLHAELFEASLAPDPDARPFDVELARSGITLHVPPDRTVVDVLADNGVEVMTSCAQGLCGSCVTTVLAGEPEHRDRFLTEAERAEGRMFTPCCSRARGARLVLDL